VLTGKVDAGGTCVIVTAHGHRWALVGAQAGGLTHGQTVTVRGRPIAVPPDCRADFAVAIRTIN
jgi:hypothetical protein